MPMTNSNTVSKTAIDTDTEVLPQAEVNSSASALPRPISTRPDIADTGRISFGAAARLPAKK
jgi:hypothetical protein